MKTILPLFLFSLLTSISLGATNDTDSEASAKPMSEEEIRRQLESIVLPRVTFRDTALSDALQSLSEMANQSLPEDQKIVIIVSPEREDSRVNFAVRNLSFIRILDIAAQQTGYEWKIVQGAVLFSPIAPGGGPQQPVGRSPSVADDPFAAPAQRYVFRSSPADLGRASSVAFNAPLAALGMRSEFDVAMFNTESYELIKPNTFRSPRVAPLSTFSIDVDSASYSNLRRMLTQGKRPPADAIRIEELINYFPYSYREPVVTGEVPEEVTPSNLPDFLEHPVAISAEVGPTPWESDTRLLRIALKGFEVDWKKRPPANLVFLLDVSGSMSTANKLPLVKESLKLLVERLNGNDRVAIVVYAGASGLALPSTTANNTETILHAINQLESGGSTNAGAGIQLAYQTALEHFIPDGINRVILCTDGDFNVGTTDKGSLVEAAEGFAEEGVFLTILGFGTGNFKDDMLEALTNAADGNYAYVDSEREARRIFLQAASGTMIPIAKDVKIQVEFNPAVVKAYRLIGYENRLLRPEDFNDDTKDAGELGAGQTVTALYEIALPNSGIEVSEVDDLKYQVLHPKAETLEDSSWEGVELATVKLRYKWPLEEDSLSLQVPVTLPVANEFAEMNVDYQMSAILAIWGMLLRESDFVGPDDWGIVEAFSSDLLRDPSVSQQRVEWAELVEKSKEVYSQTN
ncbi:MAG: VWA domain-containing protein [Verrucomicrobiota bacterium]